MTVAGETRDAVRDAPFLHDALRAGIVNYRAAAEFLDIDADAETVATALRRFAADLPARETDARDARVTMQSGVGLAVDADEAVLSVNGRGVAPGGGSQTAVLATGGVDAAALSAVLGRLATHDVDVRAAGAVAADSPAGDGDSAGSLVVVVPRRDAANAVRHVEAALDAVPV